MVRGINLYDSFSCCVSHSGINTRQFVFISYFFLWLHSQSIVSTHIEISHSHTLLVWFRVTSSQPTLHKKDPPRREFCKLATVSLPEKCPYFPSFWLNTVINVFTAILYLLRRKTRHCRKKLWQQPSRSWMIFGLWSLPCSIITLADLFFSFISISTWEPFFKRVWIQAKQNSFSLPTLHFLK